MHKSFKYLLFLFRCLNACTYCKTKHARGELGSYPPDEIVARAVQSFQGKSPKLELSHHEHNIQREDNSIFLPVVDLIGLI